MGPLNLINTKELCNVPADPASDPPDLSRDAANHLSYGPFFNFGFRIYDFGFMILPQFHFARIKTSIPHFPQSANFAYSDCNISYYHHILQIDFASSIAYNVARIITSCFSKLIPPRCASAKNLLSLIVYQIRAPILFSNDYQGNIVQIPVFNRFRADVRFHREHCMDYRTNFLRKIARRPHRAFL
jgi:hypothetical protein